MKENMKYNQDMKYILTYARILKISYLVIFISLFIVNICWLEYFLDLEIKNVLEPYKLIILIVDIILFIMLIIWIVFNKKAKETKNKFNKYYEFSLKPNITYESLSNALTNIPNLLNKYEADQGVVYKEVNSIGVFKNHKYEVNYYLLKMKEYNQNNFKNIFTKFNKDYKKANNESDKASSYNIYERYIFIFIDNWNQEVESFLNSYPNDLLRIESSMTYVIYNHKIYIMPIYVDCQSDSNYPNMNKKLKELLDTIK